MRSILAAAAVLLPALAACSESEAAFRDSYRTRAVDSCLAGARSAAAASPARVDVQRMCECIVDRYMAETSVEALRAEENQPTAPPAAQRAMTQCAAEQMGGTAKG